MKMNRPSKILLFSGKRKSGKDFITDKLVDKMSCRQCVIIKISGPIKAHWSKLKGVSFHEMISDSALKEQYRQEMIEWSDKIRSEDYGYFCRAAIDMYKAHDKLFWIVSDIRRKTDIQWFKENFNCSIKTYRVVSDEDTRKTRGWEYIEGIDDVTSECDLDDVDDWDYIIENNGSDEEIEKSINEIIHELTKCRR